MHTRSHALPFTQHKRRTLSASDAIHFIDSIYTVRDSHIQSVTCIPQHTWHHSFYVWYDIKFVTRIFRLCHNVPFASRVTHTANPPNMWHRSFYIWYDIQFVTRIFRLCHNVPFASRVTHTANPPNMWHHSFYISRTFVTHILRIWRAQHTHCKPSEHVTPLTLYI